MLFGYYTSARIPQDDDHWKKIETEGTTSFAFVREKNKLIKLESSSPESCLYLNVNDNDDSILLAVRHFFYLKEDGSYLSAKFSHYFNYPLDQNKVYPNTFTPTAVSIYELFQITY